MTSEPPIAARAGGGLHVLVAAPLGRGGHGGIDRLMDSIADELAAHPRPGVEVAFRPTRGPGHIALSPLVLAGFCARLAAARIAGRLDVVHLNLASTGSTYRKLVVAAWARLLGVPYVVHLHGGGYRDFHGKASAAMKRRIAGMFAHARRVIVLGTVWADFVAGMVPQAAARITVLANATPAPALPHRGGGESTHILFLGRLGEWKGTPQLVAALSEIAADGRWRATIAGDGAIEETRADVRDRGLDGRIAVPGWVGRDEVARLISEADILVLPSFAENLPMSIIEAMASGLAVVATPVGSVEDIVTDGETGLLVPPGDTEALAGALGRLVADAGLRERLARAGQALHRERLSIGPYADRLIALWKEAAA